METMGCIFMDALAKLGIGGENSRHAGTFVMLGSDAHASGYRDELAESLDMFVENIALMMDGHLALADVLAATEELIEHFDAITQHYRDFGMEDRACRVSSLSSALRRATCWA